MSFDAALAAGSQRGADAIAVMTLAKAALDAQREDEALPHVVAAAEAARSDARLWQWAGLLYRALDRREDAIPAFATAARLAPQDALIAHSHARTVMEAGLPAVDLFERALILAPADGSVLLGRAAARLAAGEGARAIDELDAILAQVPLWVDGHQDRISLAWMMGQGEQAFASLHAAIARQPDAPQLRQCGIFALRQAGRYDLVLPFIAAARARLGDDALFRFNAAAAHAELGHIADADAGFAPFAALVDAGEAEPQIVMFLVRHALRAKRIDVAARLIDRHIDGPAAHILWPYADTVWRLTGDSRLDWLHRGGAFVHVADIGKAIPDMGALAALLRSLHAMPHEQLDQSVRGGSQTDGSIFNRIEPEIKALRAAVVDVISDYVANLPPVDPRHPLLQMPRGLTPRFSGSWSVRLPRQGHHSNHVHPAVVISSAFYVVLPPKQPDGDPHAGWFTLDQPQAELGLAMPPSRYVEPAVGRLVLFPSQTWHGTVPFAEGERMTVAFDVAMPKV